MGTSLMTRDRTRRGKKGLDGGRGLGWSRTAGPGALARIGLVAAGAPGT